MSENRPGQGATLIDFDGGRKESADDAHVCPTCGEAGFDTRKNMKIHHTHAHGESIAGESVECDNCGEQFQRTPSEIERYEHSFCSEVCKGEWQSENHIGEDNPRWEGGRSTYECVICGSEEERYECETYDDVVCSIECNKALTSWANRGETLVERDCDYCGETYETKPAWDRKQEHGYCSRECADDAHSDRMGGDGNPRWEGGDIHDTYCGPNWESKRQQVLDRDNHACARCGSEHELQVHHIKPRREFITDGEYDYTNANQLNNLVTLCNVCHPTVEAWSLRIDFHNDS